MTKHIKKSASHIKPGAARTARDARTGDFEVVGPAVKPDKVTIREIRKVVREAHRRIAKSA